MKVRAGEKGRMAGKGLMTALFLVLLFQALLPLGFGQDIQAIPSSLKSPQEIEKWLSGFKYEMKIPDVPQTVRETLEFKSGDCDDLAKLASEALARMGIPSDIVLIKIKGVSIRHAICVWKDAQGRYNFFSNKQLIHTPQKSMEGAIKIYFPSYEKISILSSEELNASSQRDDEEWGSKRYF